MVLFILCAPVWFKSSRFKKILVLYFSDKRLAKYKGVGLPTYSFNKLYITKVNKCCRIFTTLFKEITKSFIEVTRVIGFPYSYSIKRIDYFCPEVLDGNNKLFCNINAIINRGLWYK